MFSWLCSVDYEDITLDDRKSLPRQDRSTTFHRFRLQKQMRCVISHNYREMFGNNKHAPMEAFEALNNRDTVLSAIV